jgi:hypothetical protein
VSKDETTELGYVFQVEQHVGRPIGRDETIVIALRATLVFRREGGTWKSRIAMRIRSPLRGRSARLFSPRCPESAQVAHPGSTAATHTGAAGRGTEFADAVAPILALWPRNG